MCGVFFSFPAFTGHIRLARITLADREEQKKKDREQEKLAKKNKEKEEEEVDRSKWCKYTLGLKHQVSLLDI